MDTSETYIKMCDCEEIQSQYKVGSEWEFIKEKSFFGQIGLRPIWLPRQDQIQEMMVTHFGVDDINAPLCFFAVALLSEAPEDEYLHKHQTPERLWLAFYMHEKHGKVWDGEKWVKRR